MRQRRKYCRDERTFNFFARKLIIFLFTVLFITIKGDNVDHTNSTINITNIIGDVDVDNIMNADGNSHEFKMKQHKNVSYNHYNTIDRNNRNNSSSIEFNEFIERIKNNSNIDENNGLMSSENKLKLNDNVIDGNVTGKILSRKRRYLIFPPGSSVQVGNELLIFLFLLFIFNHFNEH